MRLVLIFFITAFISQNAKAQDFRNNLHFWPISEETGKYTFTGREYFPDVPSDTLFYNAWNYIDTSFNFSMDSLVYLDTVTNSFSKRCHFYMEVPELGPRGTGVLGFTINVQCLYRNLKYSVTDVTHMPYDSTSLYGGALENDMAVSGGKLFPRHYWDQAKFQAFHLIQSTIYRFKSTMRSAAEAGTQPDRRRTLQAVSN